MSRRQKKTRLEAGAARIGAALGRVAGRIDQWKREGGKLTAELDHLMKVATGLRADLATARPPAQRAVRIASRAVKRARRRV
jgi:hypothetical protein